MNYRRLKRAMSLGSILVVVGSSFGPLAAHAAPIYNVNRTIGAGSIVGAIETDIIGPITALNIINYSLTVDDGTDGFTFTPANSILQLVFMPAEATSSGLVFDLLTTSPSGFFSIDATISATESWSYILGYDLSTQSHFELHHHSIRDPVNLAHIQQITLSSGLTSYGNVIPTPIPPTVWLFGSGLLGLVGIARRKKTS